MRVVILGCGRVGSGLAAMLTLEGHHITVIDRDQSSFDKATQRLGPSFTRDTVVGVGIDQDVLRQAGIDEAEVFVSVTSGDNTNIVAAQIAKKHFGVPRVIARVYDPIRAEAYRDSGIETICTTALSTGLFHDRVLDRAPKSISEYLGIAGEGVE